MKLIIKVHYEIRYPYSTHFRIVTYKNMWTTAIAGFEEFTENVEYYNKRMKRYENYN